MIEVTWEKRKLAMFGSDLTGRGEENFQTEMHAQPPEGIDPQEIRHLLEDDFDAAQQRRIAVSKRYNEIHKRYINPSVGVSPAIVRAQDQRSSEIEI